MREPDVVPTLVNALVTMAVAVVIGLFVINLQRGETEQASTGVVVVLVLSLAHMVLRNQRDR